MIIEREIKKYIVNRITLNFENSTFMVWNSRFNKYIIFEQNIN